MCGASHVTKADNMEHGQIYINIRHKPAFKSDKRNKMEPNEAKMAIRYEM